MVDGLNERLAALEETIARFQAGFLSTEDFHRISRISIDFHEFSWIAGWLAGCSAS